MEDKYLWTIHRWMGQAGQVDRWEQALLAQCALAYSGPSPIRSLQGQWIYPDVWGYCHQYVFSKVCIASALIDIQMCSNRCLKWRKTRDLIQSYTYFCNVSLGLILSTTNPKLREEYTRSFHIQDFGISPSRLHTHTGGYLIHPKEHVLKSLQDLLHVRKYGEFEQMETSARLQ